MSGQPAHFYLKDHELFREIIMNVDNPQILLTNDDGILSPGLWAAAEALSSLGYVTVAAPREQHSGAGRSLSNSADREIKPTTLKIGEQEWTCYAVGGSPAQSVQFGLHAILKRLPDLVVSGINYGENPSTDISMSGTVGAALEAAAHGIPALAVSLQLENEEWFSYSRTVDFSTAANFTYRVAKWMLENPIPDDVNLLNLNVPAHATPETPFRVTRLSRHRYFEPRLKEIPGKPPAIDSEVMVYPDDPKDAESDVHALRVDKIVSITPLSLDFTSRVDLKGLQALLGNLKQ
jgi:5'-nucleotidase